MNNTIIVAVGTKRRPKLDAVREALAVLGPKLETSSTFGVIGVEASSGVRHTPLSREETMSGVRNRAEAVLRVAREKNEPWKYFVGLEGGLDVIRERGNRWVFLENWAYVADASGRGSFGQSGAIALPEALASQVVDQGTELAEAIDTYAGQTGVRDAQGAWGVLTHDLITRQDSYRVALISAFAAFLP
jgi:inosine/xanthosine triphosphatase